MPSIRHRLPHRSSPRSTTRCRVLRREIETRYDFKGSDCSIERSDETLTIRADDDFKLKQVQELLRGHMAKRKVDTRAFDFQRPEKASGNSLRQTVAIKQGIDRELAQKIVKAIKAKSSRSRSPSRATNSASPAKNATTSRTPSPSSRTRNTTIPCNTCKFPRLTAARSGLTCLTLARGLGVSFGGDLGGGRCISCELQPVYYEHDKWDDPKVCNAETAV